MLEKVKKRKKAVSEQCSATADDGLVFCHGGSPARDIPLALLVYNRKFRKFLTISDYCTAY